LFDKLRRAGDGLRRQPWRGLLQQRRQTCLVFQVAPGALMQADDCILSIALA